MSVMHIFVVITPKLLTAQIKLLSWLHLSGVSILSTYNYNQLIVARWCHMWYRTGSALTQVMARWLVAWHYLNQYKLLISGVLFTYWRSILQAVFKISVHKLSLKNILVKLLTNLPRANGLIAFFGNYSFQCFVYLHRNYISRWYPAKRALPVSKVCPMSLIREHYHKMYLKIPISKTRLKITFLTWYQDLQYGFGHKYKVSAWNSHKKYDFCNTQISREHFGELMKC